MRKMTEWLKVGGSLIGPLLGENQAQVKNCQSLRSFGRANARPF